MCLFYATNGFSLLNLVKQGYFSEQLKLSVTTDFLSRSCEKRHIFAICRGHCDFPHVYTKLFPLQLMNIQVTRKRLKISLSYHTKSFPESYRTV